jgi:CheY-like chemotaxis protein
MRGKHVILVVEDDEDTYELYSEFLASAGYSVMGASNGVEAVESAMRHQPDLIIMDVALPGRNGFEAAQLLKSDPRTRHIGILCLTGLVQSRFVDLARQVGCDAFLTKPCPLARMGAEIERLLHQRGAIEPDRSTLLLVEDDDAIREALATLLGEEGFAVETAAHGRLALDYLAVNPAPDLILLDLMMPVMDGWMFRQEQELDPRLTGIPVVVLTAVQERDMLLPHPCPVIHKPVDVPILLDAVDRQLGLRRQRLATG